MINRRYMLFAVFIGILVVFTLFGYQQGKARPLKAGVVWAVVCSDAHSQTGLYREKMPERLQPGQSGEYGADMYGLLYPTYLEIRRPNSPNSTDLIIPFSQIVRLEFGSGGVKMDK